jgi:hypothetical protein
MIKIGSMNFKSYSLPNSNSNSISFSNKYDNEYKMSLLN